MIYPYLSFLPVLKFLKALNIALKRQKKNGIVGDTRKRLLERAGVKERGTLRQQVLSRMLAWRYNGKLYEAFPQSHSETFVPFSPCQVFIKV